MKGKWPYQPDMILQRGIRPAAIQAGQQENRPAHVPAHLLNPPSGKRGRCKGNAGIDATRNSRIALDIYTHTIGADKREAQSRMDKRFLIGEPGKNPLIGP
jgi:hypothetical protein